MVSKILVMAIAAVATTPTFAASQRSEAACQIVYQRAKHIGETITIMGSYEGDFERQLIIPKGCDRGIGVGAAAPEIQSTLDQGPFDGVITGVLYREKPNIFQFHDDDGIRIRITSVRVISRKHPGD